MKKSLSFCFFFWINFIAIAQQTPSTVRLFLEDTAGRKDTVIFGSGSGSSFTLGIDSLFGEANIFGTSWDSLEMRVIQRDTSYFSCLNEYDDPTPPNPGIFFPENIDTKIDFRPPGNHFAAEHNFELWLQAFDFPVVVRVDLSDLYFAHLTWSTITLLDSTCNSIQMIPLEHNLDTLAVIEDGTINTFIGHIIVHTSTEELEDSKYSWKIFPNPATTELSITGLEYKSGTLEIIDLQGRMQAKYKATNAEIATLNIENLPKGIYFLRYLNKFGELITTKKFIKT